MPIAQIDKALHVERVGQDKLKRTHPARLGDLPVGSICALGVHALLVSSTGLREWSFHGYRPTNTLPPSTPVELLTPPSIVAAIRHGLEVDLHPSAFV